MAKTKVLLIENNDIDRKSIQEMVGEICEITICSTGQDTIERLSGGSFDCALVSDVLPDMEGATLVSELELAKVPHVMLISNAEDDPEQSAAKLAPATKLLKSRLEKNSVTAALVGAVDNARQQSTPTNLPPRHPKHVRRAQELAQLHELVTKNRCTAISQEAAPHSLGGFGKTSLAVAYGWKMLRRFRGGVFFVDASSSTLLPEFAKLGDLLGIAPKANEQHAAAKVVNQLSKGEPSLIILDGLDDPNAMSRVKALNLIPQGNCRCLITTNCEALDEVSMYPIAGLASEQAILALGAYRADALDKQNEAIASDIVGWFNGYPLGISVVGAYMSLSPEVSWKNFHAQFSAVRAKTVAKEAEGENYIPFVHALLDTVLETLPAQQHFAMEYGSLMAETGIVLGWLAPMLQSEEAIKLGKILGEVQSGKQSVARLVSLQLLSARGPNCTVLGMPRALRARLNERFVNGKFQQDDTLDQLIGTCKKQLTQAQKATSRSAVRSELSAFAAFAKELALQNRVEEGAELAKRTVLALHRLGRFHEAVSVLDAFLADDVASKLKPTMVAILLSDKAASLTAADQAEEARRLMERALLLDQRHLPPNHPTLAAHYSNMAGLMKTLGNLPKARRFLEQAIQIEESHFGKDHPTLGLRHWWLGDIDLAEKKIDQARDHYKLAHEIMKKHYPKNHAQVQALTKLLKRLRS